ncbi:hypothetical protein [Rhodoblastus sp.]|uniref:hypothetical protein n=1 Tax=Rhodoblastus sp. TaxID=1962975 RepID=UPI002625F7EB|nr:hypothetical protein [Rhodoblastus sp.]
MPSTSTQLPLDLPANPPDEPDPLPCDRWTATSALQKAIRRGLAGTARRAAMNLLEHDARALWRRLTVIAVEDISIGDMDAVAETVSLAGDAKARARLGGERQAILYVCGRLAKAVKERGTDLLLSVARHAPDLEPMRELAGSVTVAQRIEHAMRPDWTLAQRAVAAWYASGLEIRPERRVGRGDLAGLLDAFATEGVPPALLQTVHAAARPTREPICAMLPLLWLTAGREPVRVETEAFATPELDGVPLCALDGHTRLGRQAIARLSREDTAIADFLVRHVPDFRAQRALQLAVFYADSTRLDRRLDWLGSGELEAEGIAADFIGARVDPGAGRDLVALVGGHIDHLNAIRAEVLSRSPDDKGDAR